MDNRIFKNQIDKELQKLDKEQVVFFTWLCAVRVLPFIGIEGNFNYWKKEERQKYLYTLFRSLDMNRYHITDVNITADFRDNARIAAEAAYNHEAYIAHINSRFNTPRIEAHAAAHAVARAIAHAANAANKNTRAAIRAAIYAIYATEDTGISTADMRNILLEDLRNIQNGQKKFDNNLELYGEIWNNFLQALNNESCSYWGNLYKHIFENNFQLNQKALEQRMSVPKEIQDQGAAEVGRYLEELDKQGAKHLNEARIIILGEKGSGKTCLARRLKNPDANMTTDEESTAGVDTSLWQPESENINVHIWDFAGHIVTHAVHQYFLSERSLYILVYDGRTEERNRIEYWLNHIKTYGGDSKVLILVNVRDQHIPEIPINSLKDDYPILGFDVFSIRNDREKLEKFRKKVVEYIKNNPSWNSQEIPANYFDVKKELEQRFAEKQKDEYIDLDEFKQIAHKNGIDDFEGLLKSLHALGICLHYEDMKDFNLLVLNPEWISQGIYKIINWVHNRDEHSISIDDFPVVFEKDADHYPKDKHPYLFKLMQRYELAYETENKGCLIIPHLLHEDRPEKLPDFPITDSLMLRYKAEQPLPAHTISRFIVRHNQEIRKEGKHLVWRYGVVLEDKKGSVAMVRESIEERVINVSVKGNDKTAYLDMLRETLNEIFGSYKSKQPELQYRITRFGQIPDEIEKSNPLWLSDLNILNHANDNVPFYEYITRQHIDLREIVEKYLLNSSKVINIGSININIENFDVTFNIQNCYVELQRNLDELASSLRKKGETEEAEELEEAVEALSEAEKYKEPEEVKKKGFVNKLIRIAEALEDKNSKLYKAVKGIKNGISIAQDIAKGYNSIAQWCGLPQVPKPLLGKA